MRFITETAQETKLRLRKQWVNSLGGPIWKPKFAWKPTRIREGVTVWLENYAYTEIWNDNPNYADFYWAERKLYEEVFTNDY